MKRILRLARSIAILISLTINLLAQSPYKISWERDGCILGTGGAVALTGIILYYSVSAPAPEEISRLNRGSVTSFDRGATYRYSEAADKTSDALYAAAAAAPFLLLTDNKIRNDMWTIGLMYAEVWSFIGGTSMMSKGAVARYRPYTYNPDAPWDKKLEKDAKMSFFSNHTATAFASAVFISTVYKDYHPDSKLQPYIWGVSLLTAGYVGYLRYEAGMHFPTDIIAGAAVGSIAGYVIPCMHRTGSNEVTITPYSPYADYGISLQLKF